MALVFHYLGCHFTLLFVGLSLLLYWYNILTTQQVEWCGGSETMEEILARIHQREEAAVKRERTMAYAFSHQVCCAVVYP